MHQILMRNEWRFDSDTSDSIRDEAEWFFWAKTELRFESDSSDSNRTAILHCSQQLPAAITFDPDLRLTSRLLLREALETLYASM